MFLFEVYCLNYSVIQTVILNYSNYNKTLCTPGPRRKEQWFSLSIYLGLGLLDYMVAIFLLF